MAIRYNTGSWTGAFAIKDMVRTVSEIRLGSLDKEYSGVLCTILVILSVNLN